MEITVKRIPADEADEASYTLVFETEDFSFRTSVPSDELVKICKIIIIEEAESRAGLPDQEIKH